MNERSSAREPGSGHTHEAITEHALRQRGGVPFEVERVVCPACRRVLAERTVRRAAA